MSPARAVAQAPRHVRCQWHWVSDRVCLRPSVWGSGVTGKKEQDRPLVFQRSFFLFSRVATVTVDGQAAEYRPFLIGKSSPWDFSSATAKFLQVVKCCPSTV